MALTFRRLGRSKQATVHTVADLESVLSLDDALWVSTAAPIVSLRLDKVFLSLVDGDGDGRIRSDELRGAIRFLLDAVSSRAGADAGSDSLDDGAVNASGEHGEALLDAMKRIRGDLGVSGALSLTQVRALRSSEEAKGLSSAGRVLPAAAGNDTGLARFLSHIIETTGGEPHPSGDPSVTASALDTFLDEGAKWLAWHDEGAIPQVGSTDIRVLGAQTGTASDALAAVVAKLDQYFLLCDAIALDPDLAASTKVDASGSDLLDPVAATALLERAPIAAPRADGVLDLNGAVNPAYRARLAALLDNTVKPLLGDDTATLTRDSVAELSARLAPFAAWSAAKPASKAADSGVELLRAHLGQSELAEATRELLAKSEVAAVALDGIKLVEKVILFQKYLLTLANNMVTIPDLFDPRKRAAMERGHLVFDGRVLSLSIPVFERPRAERFAKMSPMFILFVLVGEKGSALNEEYMVPVTAGERGHLVDGQWGIHFDVDGKERHAFIRSIAVNPISIKEALLAPFRRAADALQSALDKASASSTGGMDAAVTKKAGSVASGAANAAESTAAQGQAARAAAAAPPTASNAAPAAEAPASSGSSLMGSLPLIAAGAGIALAALAGAAAMVLGLLGDAAGYLASFVVGLPVVQALGGTAQSLVSVAALPVAVLVVALGVLMVPVLMYVIPISLATWFRLRRRDLATLLEGTGWAINTRLYLDRDLANQLTQTPKAP